MAKRLFLALAFVLTFLQVAGSGRTTASRFLVVPCSLELISASRLISRLAISCSRDAIQSPENSS